MNSAAWASVAARRTSSSVARGRPKRIVVAAHGPLSEFDARLLTVAALNGVFQGRVDQAVNYVNAPVIAPFSTCLRSNRSSEC